jgi:hypothetical protein
LTSRWKAEKESPTRKTQDRVDQLRAELANARQANSSGWRTGLRPDLELEKAKAIETT